MKRYFSVTTYRRSADRPIGNLLFRDRRTVGIFETFEEADRVVMGNYGDIAECGYYQYAVVEEAEYGLYAPIRTQTFYECILRPGDPHSEGDWVRLDGIPEPLLTMFGTHMYNWSDIG